MDERNFFIVSNGKRVLHLYPAEEGGYTVLCPYDPSLITQADTIEEAFVMAEDAAQLLAEYRAEKAQPKAKARKTGAKRKPRRSPARY